MPRGRSRKRSSEEDNTTSKKTKASDSRNEASATSKVSNDDKAGKEFKNEVADEREGENPPVLLFAHGAGAPSTSEWMVRWKDMLISAANAVEVITFDYPYFKGGKKTSPPKAEKLVDFHVQKAKEAAEKYPGHPLILVGKSMGSRISCMVSKANDVNAAAVICLGYPLKGMNGTLRDETLLQLTVPVLFVQGSKDGLCPLGNIEAVRKKMQAENELYVVDGGDHSLMVGKKLLKEKGISQNEVEEPVLVAVGSFVKKVLSKLK